jgi:RNA polymerase sigma-70 factor, ECF subfamily
MTTPKDTMEQDLTDIQAVRQGDGASYERLVRRHQQAIGAYLWRFTRDQRERDELVQDTFVEAYLSLGSYAGRAPWEHWLKVIATRAGYRYWRRRDRTDREVPIAEKIDQIMTTESAAANAREASEIVHLLLAELAPRDRLVMTLTYLEQRSMADIAELTGWSISMVKVQAFRARKRLAKICEQQGIEL